jgi:hypothetical protein
MDALQLKPVIHGGERKRTAHGLAAAISRLVPFLVAALFVVALWLLNRELASYSYRDVLRAVAAVSDARLLGSVGLTVFAYAVLVGYDAIALSYVRHPLHCVALRSALSSPTPSARRSGFRSLPGDRCGFGSGRPGGSRAVRSVKR